MLEENWEQYRSCRTRNDRVWMWWAQVCFKMKEEIFVSPSCRKKIPKSGNWGVFCFRALHRTLLELAGLKIIDLEELLTSHQGLLQCPASAKCCDLLFICKSWQCCYVVISVMVSILPITRSRCVWPCCQEKVIVFMIHIQIQLFFFSPSFFLVSYIDFANMHSISAVC